MADDFDDEMKLEYLHGLLERDWDMDSFCLKLGNAGAMFWERMEDCPHVIGLGLIEAR